jgi:hypothetical protein
VASRADEVQASVHPQVSLLAPLGLLLLSHVRFMLVVDELDDGNPRVTVVHVVTEARSVNDGEFDLELLLLELSLDNFNLGEFVKLLEVTLRIVFGRGELGGKEGVDEGGLSESRLACFTVSINTRISKIQLGFH